MEITNLENPIDDELMTELRDLAHKVEGLLDRVDPGRITSVCEVEPSEFRCLGVLIEGTADFLN
jgi:hypothetical protein